MTTPRYFTHTCPKCRGKGVIAGFVAVNGGKCSRCLGSGKVSRKAPEKRQTEQERLDAFNARLAELYPQ